jgi:hypothetical protein
LGPTRAAPSDHERSRYLIVRDTELGIVDRVADLAFAARTVVALDLVVVTPEERETTFSRSSFGRTVLSTAQRIYAA